MIKMSTPRQIFLIFAAYGYKGLRDVGLQCRLHAIQCRRTIMSIT